MNFKNLIRRYFFGKEKKSAPDRSIKELRTAFQTRYWSFKTLLKSNNEILEIMADMEKVIGSGRSFGMSYVRANCTAISVNLFKMIQNLNIIGHNRYSELFKASDDIWEKINSRIEEKKTVSGNELILNLKAVDKGRADQTGSKMANLGEIKNRLGMPVPEGFVITAAAYERFIESNMLQQEINRRIQTLDTDNIEMLHRVSSEIQQLILRAAVPPDLEKEIMQAYAILEGKTEKRVSVSLRSSALGEDTLNVSFAGQYRSALNVSRDFIPYTYKEIVASKYTLQAISYRLNRGFRDEDIPMCVGCMEMVDAVAGGVMYSRDPGDFRDESIIINSAWGLAKSVVEGSVSPDIFIVSRSTPKIVLRKVIQDKEKRIISGKTEGVTAEELSEDERGSPSLTDDIAVKLAGIAERLEDYFGYPQDIEWSLARDGDIRILQARPLKQSERHGTAQKIAPDIKNEVIIDKGVTASSGIACGKAFLVKSTLDMLQFPKGSVLVTRYPSPQWASLLSHTAAVITDSGSITGHLATVAREFGVPAIFNSADATQKIRNGDLLTVDADGTRVYSGEVKELLTDIEKKISLMEGSPVFILLKNIMKMVTPLNLTNPESLDFRPKNCKTVHDITRFCHEMSVREMFEFGKEHDYAERSAKRLASDVPMQWWVLNLEDGFRHPVEGDTVKMEDIVSEPMLAIWEGITAFKWKGPPPVDTKGFMSVMFEATMNKEIEPSMRSGFVDNNYFIISKNFCNLSSRLGFHFSIVEAYIADWPKDNYISFNFKGGAADYERKVRRVEFIGKILKQFGFRIEMEGDTIIARLEGLEKDYLLDRLKILGYLVIHTRQIDMIMNNDAAVQEYYEDFLKDINSFIDSAKNNN
ncbi:MAG: PEP/pyruvate-binding domain-containing protein [Nitrospirota bacterium]